MHLGCGIDVLHGTKNCVVLEKKNKQVSIQTQLNQLESQIKTMIWLLGITDAKQTFSLSSRGRLADPNTLILFISFFSESESELNADEKFVLAFNPQADVKACSSRDAFTWR